METTVRLMAARLGESIDSTWSETMELIAQAMVEGDKGVIEEATPFIAMLASWKKDASEITTRFGRPTLSSSEKEPVAPPKRNRRPSRSATAEKPAARTNGKVSAKSSVKARARKGWPKSSAPKGEFTNVGGYRPFVEKAAKELGAGAQWRSIQDKAWEIMQAEGASKAGDAEKSPGTSRPRYLAQMSALLQYMKKRGDASVDGDKVTFKNVEYKEPKKSAPSRKKSEERELATATA